jgi:hypothetical protein
VGGHITPSSVAGKRRNGMDAIGTEKNRKHDVCDFFLPLIPRPTGVECAPPVEPLIKRFATGTSTHNFVFIFLAARKKFII